MKSLTDLVSISFCFFILKTSILSYGCTWNLNYQLVENPGTAEVNVCQQSTKKLQFKINCMRRGSPSCGSSWGSSSSSWTRSGAIIAMDCKSEKFRGSWLDDVEDFLRKFDRHVNLCGTKQNQRFDLLCLHLEGRTSLYVDSLHPQPAVRAARSSAKIDVSVKLSQKLLDII